MSGPPKIARSMRAAHLIAFPAAPIPNDGAQERMKLRVLVVDDDTRLLETLRAVLEDDMEVSTCTGSQDALALLEETSFDVVCSDHRMPGMSGADLLKRIATAYPYTATLLVTGTAFHHPETSEGALRYVLLKPFDPDRFLAIVRQLGRIAQKRRADADALAAARAGDGGEER